MGDISWLIFGHRARGMDSGRETPNSKVQASDKHQFIYALNTLRNRWQTFDMMPTGSILRACELSMFLLAPAATK